MKGFTRIELQVAIALIAAAVAFAMLGLAARAISNSNTPPTTLHCVSGYQVITDRSGRATQLVDQFGKGIPCN